MIIMSKNNDNYNYNTYHRHYFKIYTEVAEPPMSGVLVTRNPALLTKSVKTRYIQCYKSTTDRMK